MPLETDKKILVVDDSADIVELLAMLLGRRGYEIVSGRDGAEALVLARRERPDLILMDIEMPHISGLAACRLLRAEPTFERIPIVLLTSDDAPETIVRGLAAGANDYVLKTVPHDELFARIERHLSTHASFVEQISEERLEAIGQIALSIQHEIFNPLTSIVGFVELALRQPELSEKTRRYLETARAEATRIQDTVRRLTAVEDRRVDPFGIGEMIDLSADETAPVD